MNAWFGTARIAASKPPVECAWPNVLNGGVSRFAPPRNHFSNKVSEHYA